MRTAVYARTKDATEMDRMSEQIETCLERAENADVEIFKEYGPSSDVYRPELYRMMKDVRDGKIQRVIVKDVARLSRSMLHLTALMREMEESGCTLLSVADGIDTGRSYDENEGIQKMITMWDRRQQMREMEKSGRYHFYGEKIDDIPDEQVEDRYMQMQNFLSDARTHDY